MTVTMGIGTRFGKYVLAKKLGAGAMGEVYLAEDSELHRPVALKLLKGGDDEEVARFKREASIAGRLSHPNIAAVYEVGEDGGRHYIAMQYIDGVTLKGCRRTDLAQLVMLMKQAANAVAYAHQCGIVHRDLKPENLMVDRNGRLFVMDFGLARSVKGPSNLSATGLVAGTPAYMSPEQATAERIDERTDVWSLGATLYDLLTGLSPFRGANIYDTLRRVQDEDPKPPKSVNPEIPKDLEAVVLKCLEKKRRDRYPNALALAQDLERWLDREPVLARPAGPFLRLGRRLSKRKPLVIMGGIAFLAISAAIAVAANLMPKWRGEEKARQATEKALDDQKVDQARKAAAMERARTPLEAGQRALDEIRVLKRDPDYTDDQLHTIASRAIRAFTKALKEVPNLPEGILGVARALAASGEREMALLKLKDLVRLVPAFAAARLERVRILVDRYDELIDEKAQNPGFTKDAEAVKNTIAEDLRVVAKYAADDEERLYGDAMLASIDGKHQVADRLLSQYLKAVPTDSTAHGQRGKSLRALGDDKTAIVECTEALKNEARNVRVLVTRANAKIGVPDVDGAIADCTQAIKYSPKDPWLYRQRGLFLMGTLDRDGAFRDATESLMLLDDWYGWWLMSLARYFRGDYQEGIAAADRSIALAPTLPDPHVSKAQILAQMDDNAGAIAEVKVALKLSDDAGRKRVMIALKRLPKEVSEAFLPKEE